jgi:uncharacterized membrane protein YgdD (TMEM256/DUF423 family)
MPQLGRILLCCAALLLLAATGLGAYASHGLPIGFDASSASAVQTAINFQFFPGLGLLGVVILIERHPRLRSLWLAGGLFVAGSILFCGSIYATRLLGLPALGGLAPTGGVCLMAGWLALAWGALNLPSRGRD